MNLHKATKRRLALLLAFTMALSIFAPVSVFANTEVVWSMTEWIADLGLSVGDVPPQEDEIVDAGATLTVAEGNSIYVNIGTNNWGAGIDILVSEGVLDIREGDVVTVSFRADAHADGSVFRFSPYQSNWDLAGSVGLLNRITLTGAGQSDTMQVTVTDTSVRCLRFGGAWADPNTNVNFYVTEILIERSGGVAAANDDGADDSAEAAEPTEVADDNAETVEAPTPPAVVTPPPAAPAGARELRFVVDSTTFTDNGANVTLEAAPFIADGRTMVPLRVIAEAFGATDLAMENNVVSFVLDGRSFTLPIGQYIPGVGTPEIVEGRTFVPLRFVIDELDADWHWDGAANAAYIFI